MSKRLRVLHCLDNSNIGGIQEMILKLYQHSTHTHEFWAADGSMAPIMRHEGMLLWPGGPPEGDRYDVVVGHTVGGWSHHNLSGWSAARGAKFVECMHSNAVSPTPPADVDCFVGVSYRARDLNPQFANRITIYPPVETHLFGAGAHNCVGRLSRLVEEKRPYEFALLAREFPGEKFLLAGDGPERSRISTTDNLFLLGWVRDFPAFYGMLKLFVFPTKDECCCVSVAMAQAAGVPVICQDIPALRETTGGYAAFARSHGEFVDQVRHALEAPGAFAQMAKYGQAWAREHFGIEHTVWYWDSLLMDLCR